MHESVVEMETGICNNIQEVKAELTDLRKRLIKVAHENNLRVAGGGTHPFSRWEDNPITKAERYDKIVSDLGDVARSNLIFGLHVHIGLDSKEDTIHIMNALRYFLPHIFALSTSSPFWKGRKTGFKSYRTKIFDRFPRTGIPDHFNSYGEFESYVNLLIKTGCIDNAKRIWWDVRPHPFFNTLEVRICDIPMLVDETIAIAALIQAVVAKLYKLLKKNLGFRLYRRLLINENKWRAARYGLEGKMIDFGKQEEVDTVFLIHELLNFVDEVVDELDSRDEINFINEILKMKTGAYRQLQVFEKTKDLKKVVDYIIEQTNQGLNT